jgi:galactofuranosylgalactofuranosylrhamnosyl-N-acetylglucosaminyl-diphospho-decaprenol beta-1,5/1,6-galactofuranosyltransferase
MADVVIQRVVFAPRPGLDPLYHRADGAEPAGRFSARVGAGGRLSTDTYFNTLFERPWRRDARVGRLRLRLALAGTGTVRVVRRAGAGQAVVAAGAFRGARAEVALDVPDPGDGPAGWLHFEVVAGAGPVLLRRAEWVAVGADPDPVRLAVGCCTFDREAEVLRTVGAVLGDPEVAAAVEQVVVVDQGTRPVRRHPGYWRAAARAGAKLRVVEQGNFGGAGGFTRAILEARDGGRATHVLLMDDDVEVEPETVFRAVAFLSLARGGAAVGAPMLDATRPLEVAAAGSRVDLRRLWAGCPAGRRRADTAESLGAFADPPDAHYNPWWFLAFPLRLTGRVGLPLPLFIRGDDAEWGYRLRRAGVRTITLPGTGVWHEPFDRKAGGWQPYYDFRNLLILSAVHRSLPAWRAAAHFLQRLGYRLLRLDYREAALLCDAAADFRRGPGLVAGDPRAVHRRVVARHAVPPAETRPRDREPLLPAPAPPRSRPFLLLWCVARQLLRRSPRPGAPVDVTARATDWATLARADVAAVDGPDPGRDRVLRRSRPRFLALLARGLGEAGRLWLQYRRVARAWRAAAPKLTSDSFWRRYLRLGAGDPTAGRRAA